MYKEYSWQIAGIYKSDANIVGRELEKIEQIGELTPESVLEYARANEQSELHKMIEWDDSIASERWRRHQASHIITHIKVEIIQDDTKRTNKPIRAFVQTARLQKYEPIETFIKDTDKYKLLLEKAYRELNNVKNKYTELEEIQELLKDIPEY